MHLTENKKGWRALVNTVMCNRVPENVRNFLTSWGIYVYLLTYSMVQSPSWAAIWFAATQEIPSISRNPKVHYRTHKRPPTVSILGQPNPVHICKASQKWFCFIKLVYTSVSNYILKNSIKVYVNCYTYKEQHKHKNYSYISIPRRDSN